MSTSVCSLCYPTALLFCLLAGFSAVGLVSLSFNRCKTVYWQFLLLPFSGYPSDASINAHKRLSVHARMPV